MQVVILCGGQGTRIRDVAEDVPKPLIPIGHRPILWHIMKTYAHHGFNRFVLCLGYKGWAIKRYFLEYHLFENDFTVTTGAPGHFEVHAPITGENWHVTLAETGAEAMTGCRVKRVERYIEDDCFLLTYGDGVADVNIAELVRFHRQHGKIGTVTAVRQPCRFGELELDGECVVDFNEKPIVSGGYINGGFFVFDRRLFDRLTDDPANVFERQPLKDLARDGELMTFKHHGFWHAMDSSRDFGLLNRMWSEGQAPWNVWDAPLRRAA